MRAIIALLLALSLVVGLADDADAQQQAGKQKAYAKKRARSPEASNARQRPRSDYVEHLADKLPFGSSEWWAQMQREQRLGGDTP